MRKNTPKIRSIEEVFACVGEIFIDYRETAERYTITNKNSYNCMISVYRQVGEQYDIENSDLRHLQYKLDELKKELLPIKEKAKAIKKDSDSVATMDKDEKDRIIRRWDELKPKRKELKGLKRRFEDQDDRKRTLGVLEEIMTNFEQNNSISPASKRGFSKELMHH